MTEIQKFDKKSLIEKRYQEDMWFLMNVMRIVLPERYREPDPVLQMQYLPEFKCMHCKNFYIDNDGDFACKRKKKKFDDMKNIVKWNCRWLMVSYSEILQLYRDYHISMDEIVKKYDKAKKYVKF